MIITQSVIINDLPFMKTYSSNGTIERDGVQYDTAIDPIDSGRVYTETNQSMIDENIEREN